MKKLTTVSISLLMAGIGSHAFAADEKAPNPADFTETSTSGKVALDNKGNFKPSISADHTFANGQTGMLTVEGTMDKEGGYSDSRLQYFHVFSTDNSVVKRVAASVDVIDNSLFSSVSVGTTFSVDPGVKGLNFFPRIGGLAGKYSSEVMNQFNVDSDEGYGISAALYMLYTIGDDGTYIGAWPEYNYMDGDIESSVLASTVMIATPFSADKKRWGQIHVKNTQVSMQSAAQTIESNDTAVWAMYKFYFLVILFG